MYMKNVTLYMPIYTQIDMYMDICRETQRGREREIENERDGTIYCVSNSQLSGDAMVLCVAM